jgi:hypothetical protein
MSLIPKLLEAENNHDSGPDGILAGHNIFIRSAVPLIVRNGQREKHVSWHGVGVHPLFGLLAFFEYLFGAQGMRRALLTRGALL